MKITASLLPSSSLLQYCKEQLKITCRTLWLVFGLFFFFVWVLGLGLVLGFFPGWKK